MKEGFLKNSSIVANKNFLNLTGPLKYKDGSFTGYSISMTVSASYPTSSNTIAMPCPPPTHKEASPRL